MSNALYVQVGIIWLAIVSCGMSSSFPAIGIPAILDSGTSLSPTEISIVGTLRQFGIMAGAILIGPLLDNWGRRKGMLASLVPAMAGYLIIMIFDSVITFCVGLILEGIAMGMTNSSAAVYLAEALSKEWRGAIGVTRHVAMSVGLTLTNVLGLLIKGNMQFISFIAMILPTMAFSLSICFIKETKEWAEKSVTNQEMSKKSFAETYMEFGRAVVTRPEVYKPFAILNFLNFLRHSTGSGVFVNYSIMIIAESGAAMDPYIVAIILGLCRTGGGILGVVSSKFIGRWNVMLGSGVLMTVCMAALSVLHYKEQSPQFVPELLLVLFVSTAVIFQSITLSLQGEMFPTELRGMSSSTTITISNLEAALVLFTYPLLKAWAGSGTIMLLYSLACAACVLVSYYLVPDTDNKSLDEIGQMFQKKNNVAAAADTEEELPLRNRAIDNDNDTKASAQEIPGR